MKQSKISSTFNIIIKKFFSKSLIPAVPLIGGFSCFQNFLVCEEDLIQINFFALKIISIILIDS